VFQNPIGGTIRSTRRGVSNAGRFVLLKFSTLVDDERTSDGSSFTLQINAPFKPSMENEEKRNVFFLLRYLRYDEHVLV